MLFSIPNFSSINIYQASTIVRYDVSAVHTMSKTGSLLSQFPCNDTRMLQELNLFIK